LDPIVITDASFNGVGGFAVRLILPNGSEKRVVGPCPETTNTSIAAERFALLVGLELALSCGINKNSRLLLLYDCDSIFGPKRPHGRRVHPATFLPELQADVQAWPNLRCVCLPRRHAAIAPCDVQARTFMRSYKRRRLPPPSSMRHALAAAQPWHPKACQYMRGMHLESLMNSLGAEVLTKR